MEKENDAGINNCLLQILEDEKVAKSRWEEVVNGNVKLRGNIGRSLLIAPSRVICTYGIINEKFSV